MKPGARAKLSSSSNDTIAWDAGTDLKRVEKGRGLQKDGKLYTVHSFVERIVLAVNTLRYMDGSGDPKGSKVFLGNNGLPCGIIPR